MSDTYQPIYDAIRSRIHACDVSSIVESVIRQQCDFGHAIVCIKQEFAQTAYDMRRPHVLMRPALSVDGDKWCALYGENIMEGVAGFGDTPEKAMIDFDMQWLNRGVK